jgi:shikimate dehydrogenase
MSVDDVQGDSDLIVTGGYRSVGNYCVIGHPIAQSMSPTLHNAWFKDMDLAFRYVALDIPAGELVVRAPALPFEYSGINVTTPHKTAILGFVDRIDEDAEGAGAANLLYRDKESKAWTAGNVDGAGFIAGFEEATGAPLFGRDVLLLGAGGAARAIAAAVAKQRPNSLVIANRTAAGAIELAKRVGAAQALSLDANVVARCDTTPDLIINTLPPGAEPFFFDLKMDGLQDQAVLVDINYHVPRPALLARGESMGLMTVDGRAMFLWQAALSFQRWFGDLPNMNLGRDVMGM